MAAPVKDAKKPAAGPPRAKKTSKSSIYNASGTEIKRSARFCPKCGPGVFMANHETRAACGNCGYSEWKTKA